MTDFKTTIGLEIHVQLATKSKMFCRCDNDSDKAKPNINVCPRCLGMPGTLPVANHQAIEWTIKTGLALNCQIPEISKFDRKHYFYPDLPKGYQISQYDQPLCVGGELKVKGENGKEKVVVLNRIHLEEDAGKLVHRGSNSLVDLNRASTPLMEIVTEPCIESPAEAREFLQQLQLIIRYLKVSSAEMEKGHLRCDANISISKISSNKKTKPEMSEIVEIKNLNSFKFVEKALLIEEKRLREKYQDWPEKLTKVTRGYNSDKDITFAQRKKEEASDYRYFPEPDVPTIRIGNHKSKIKNGEWDFDLNKIKASIGYLPHQLHILLAKNQIPRHIADKIINNPEHAWYVIESQQLSKELVLWVAEEVNAQITVCGISYSEYKKRVPIDNLSGLIDLLKSATISATMAKEVFSEMVKSGKKAKEIVAQRGLEQISDDQELKKVIMKILNNNKAETDRLKKGEKKLLAFFVGQAMKETKGRANPKIVTEIINAQIK